MLKGKYNIGHSLWLHTCSLCVASRHIDSTHTHTHTGISHMFESVPSGYLDGERNGWNKSIKEQRRKEKAVKYEARFIEENISSWN